MAKSVKKTTAVSKSPAKKSVSKAKEQATLFPSDLGPKASKDISAALNSVLADVFALYFKTKNFHWHVSGPHFRDYHLMFDEQAAELFAMIDTIAERIRKLGGTTIRSIGHISKLQNIKDNDADFVEAIDMLKELGADNVTLIKQIRQAHDVCGKYNDTASAGFLEDWINEAEQRAWFLFETSRQ